MESNETFSSVSGSHDILFYHIVVCWWPNWISFVSDHLQPGMRFCFTCHGVKVQSPYFYNNIYIALLNIEDLYAKHV